MAASSLGLRGASRQGESLNLTHDVGPYIQGVQRGLETKDLRDLKHLTIHDMKATLNLTQQRRASQGAADADCNAHAGPRRHPRPNEASRRMQLVKSDCKHEGPREGSKRRIYGT